MDQIIKENSLKVKSFCKSINVHVPLCIKLIYLLANNNFFFFEFSFNYKHSLHFYQRPAEKKNLCAKCYILSNVGNNGKGWGV